MPDTDAAAELAEIARQVSVCTRCALSKGRNHAVPGEGNPSAELMFVGEAPGRDEDLQGKPFVGRSGQLLTKMIQAMGLKREDVFIGNVLKCRPPGNRDPLPEEIACCKSYLRTQIELIHPRVIMPLGSYAAKWLISPDVRITHIRGQVIEMGEYQVVPTFHPSYLMRRPQEKGKAWHDLQVVMKILGLEVKKG